MKIKDMTEIALFAAITGVLSQIAIPLPFSPVPMTLQTLAVFMAGAVLGSRKGAWALTVYALMGAVGLPVFAQAKGGLAVLSGPTGGYIIGFILAAFLIGLIVEKAKKTTYFTTLLGMFAGVVVIYMMGVLQLKLVLGVSFPKAVILGAAPYLPLEVIKVLFGAYIGNAVRNRL